jgi:hypothetical protein
MTVVTFNQDGICVAEGRNVRISASASGTGTGLVLTGGDLKHARELFAAAVGSWYSGRP